MARPRKPTHLKLVQGTARPDRINRNEPQPQRKRPRCPSHISDGAKAQWRHFAQLLDEMGVLTEADGPALAALAETADDLAQARRALVARGGSLTYTAENGMERVWPEVRLIDQFGKRLASWLARFGMTPADRSRVSVAERTENDPLDDMFT
jgi:P27 family predicted phage terminase small subunit